MIRLYTNSTERWIFCKYYYRPQTKFAKVMFSQVSVCPQREGGTWAGTPQASTPPRQVHPQAGSPPGRCTPWVGTPRAGTPPRPQCMLGYGQQAGGTHPTGMHSCIVLQPTPQNLQRSNAKSMTYCSTDKTVLELIPNRFYIKRSNTHFTPDFYVLQKNPVLCVNLRHIENISNISPRIYIF